MEAAQREVKQYLRVHLRLERGRRERAAVHVQAVWRGTLTRRTHPVSLCVLRRLHLRGRTRFSVSLLHLSAPARGGLPCAPAAALQAHARGFLVRRRAAWWRTRTQAVLRLQAVYRGVRSRRATQPQLRTARLEARVASLEDALRSESHARQLAEAYLRKMSEAVKVLHLRTAVPSPQAITRPSAPVPVATTRVSEAEAAASPESHPAEDEEVGEVAPQAAAEWRRLILARVAGVSPSVAEGCAPLDAASPCYTARDEPSASQPPAPAASRPSVAARPHTPRASGESIHVHAAFTTPSISSTPSVAPTTLDTPMSYPAEYGFPGARPSDGSLTGSQHAANGSPALSELSFHMF
jgi:hypothetical protein